MTIPTEPRTNSLYHASELAAGSVFSARRATVVLLVAFGAYLVVAPLLVASGASLLVIAVVGELVLVAVPIVFVRLERGHREMLGLRRPATRFVIAALLVGCSQWYLNLVLVDALDSWLRLSSETSIDRLQQVAVDPALALSLAGVALAPAICEEILFRGVLARGLATRFVPAAAVVTSAIVFSAFHLSAIQAVPTLLLGLVYGYMALAARSCIPTIIAHLVNNAVAILVAQGAVPWFARVIGYHTGISTGVAFALTTAGVLLAIPRRP